MLDSVTALVIGLQQLLTWPTPMYLIAGVAIGCVVGVLPGLGAPAALAIMLPALIPLAPLDGFVLLTAVAAVAASAGDLTSILLGVPGEATAAAIVADGNALARRGEGGRAVGAALMASWLGAIIGACVLALFVPFAQPILGRVQSPELAALAVLGICLIVPLSRSQPVKGLASGSLGLALASVGLDPSGALPRFTLGQLELWDGLGLFPVALGLYAVPEMLETLRAKPVDGPLPQRPADAVLSGCFEAIKHAGLLFRCSVIGAGIGVLPGVGASVSQWIAYAHAGQSTPRRDAFGAGAIEGVIGPAAATTATLGGALVPTLALGIPGSVATAFLLVALTFKGITPGPGLLMPERDGGHLSLVFSLVWCIVAASALGALIGVGLLRWVARLSRVPASRLFPIIMTLVVIGTVGERHAVADLGILAVLSGLGYVMAVLDWPRAPLVLGFVLGPLLERRLLLSNDVYGWSWVLRPSVLFLGAAVVVFLFATSRGRRTDNARARHAHAEYQRGDVSMAIALVVFAAAGLWCTQPLTSQAALFPRLAFGTMMCLSIAHFVLSIKHRSPGRRELRLRLETTHMARVAWLAFFIANAWLLGVVVGTCVSAVVFLRTEGREKWLPALGMTAVLGVTANVLMTNVLRITDERRVISWWFSS